MKSNVQDLRIVKNQDVESILFEVPHPVEFKEQENFRKICSLDLQTRYSNCNIIIVFKSQMTMR